MLPGGYIYFLSDPYNSCTDTGPPLCLVIHMLPLLNISLVISLDAVSDKILYYLTHFRKGFFRKNFLTFTVRCASHTSCTNSLNENSSELFSEKVLTLELVCACSPEKFSLEKLLTFSLESYTPLLFLKGKLGTVNISLLSGVEYIILSTPFLNSDNKKAPA